MTENTPKPLLEIKDLDIEFESSTGIVQAVRKANLVIYPGQTVAIVGESGSGKSTTAAAINGLLPGTGKVVGGQIIFDGKDITGFTEKQFVELRGKEIGKVPQDPMSNLNPVWSIGFQLKEALKANGYKSENATVSSLLEVMKKDPQAPNKGLMDRFKEYLQLNRDRNEKVAQLLEEAGLPDAKRRAKQYPHEFSGGMRQRALIAIGMSANPKLLIADEPTSALDVTVQRIILDHLGQLTKEHNTALLFITHDLGLAAERAEHLVVMHRGRVVESGNSLDILRNPQHPYTKRLVDAAPSLASQRIQSAHAQGIQVAEDELLGAKMGHVSQEPIVEITNLTKVFDIRGAKGEAKKLKAVDEVSFNLRRGTTLAVVGESGSGKSTVANMVLGLLEPTSGTIKINGMDTSKMSRAEKFKMRRKMQVVFQNPYGSLDPMYSIYRCIEEPLRVHGIGDKRSRQARVEELLDQVSLPKSAMRRYPNELSGGQRQRVAIARALALKPELVVLDEAVSALDVLVQDQILEILNDLQAQMGLSYLFITHDLAVVRQIADDVVVMESGKLVEHGPADEIFDNPRELYTRELIEAVPGAGLL
ncbi:ABC transporter ATP-binding protein [Actinomycetaceae bacterium TAE3-ERU4]|nr:ABC transporter ATP-binding protein [Actinomycetaceae bacterium TAE3-ERU4]